MSMLHHQEERQPGSLLLRDTKHKFLLMIPFKDSPILDQHHHKIHLLQYAKEALEEVFENYKKERADEKGNIRESKLTDNQAKGLMELKEKIKH